MSWIRDHRGLAAGAVVGGIVVILLIVRLVSGGGGGGGEVVTDVAVHVGAVEQATLHRYVTAYGYVEPEPARSGRAAAGALISPIVGGVVAEIDCVEGGRVERGAVLVRLDSRLAKVAVERAQHELDLDQQAFDRQQQLLPNEGTSQKAYQEAKTRLETARSDLASAQTQLAYLQLTTPLSGTVTRLDAEIGQYVDPSTVLAEVVDLRRLIAAVDVPVDEARDVAVGQPVVVGSDSVPHGRVTVIGRDVDPRTGTRRIQVALPSGAEGYRPGQFLSVRVVTAEHRDVLAVPEVALVTRAGEGSWIMVVQGDSAVRRPVTVGIRDAGLVEVSGEGLTAGMSIVTDDAYSLPEETKIRVVTD